MGTRKPFKKPVVAPFAVLLAILLVCGACSGEEGGNTGQPNRDAAERSPAGVTRPSTTTAPETTARDEPPEITLGEEPGGEPEAVLRLEGGPRTTFSGLCTVGGQESVLSGQVPKRFTFDLNGEGLSCRIEKRDSGRGALKAVLVAGNTTRSVQQTNSPGATMNISYRGG